MANSCPVCSDDRATPITVGEDFEYRSLPGPFTMLRCGGCGHGHLDPVPPKEHLPTIYPDTYYTVNPRSPIAFSPFIYNKKMQRDVARIVGLAKGRALRAVADLGCGDAERLARIGEALGGGGSVDLIGVDFQPDPDKLPGLAERGVRMVHANIEGGLDELEDDSLDLVIMCQIIEHLYDPAGALRAIEKKLAPGGLLLIETPNIGGIDYHLFKQRYWGACHFPRHFHLFTVDSLLRVVGDAGLEVAAKGFIPSGFLILSLRNKLGLDSIERSRKFGEFLSMKNLPVVGFFTALDLMMITLGRQTSNQYVLARKPAGGAA